MNPLERGRRLEEVWQQFPHDERQEFERRYGSWESLDDTQRYGKLRAYANSVKKQEREAREDERFRRHLDPIVKALEGFAEISDQHHRETSERLRAIEVATSGYSRQIDRLETRLNEQKALPSSTPPASAPQPVLNYTNCIRRHPPSEGYQAGRPGPERCIEVTVTRDQTVYKCIVAEFAQSSGSSGFARTDFQILHSGLLRAGDCPQPFSRNISRRVPGTSWLLYKNEVCPLADGKEHYRPRGQPLV